MVVSYVHDIAHNQTKQLIIKQKVKYSIVSEVFEKISEGKGGYDEKTSHKMFNQV